MKQRVLVLGAGGFIGSRVVKELAASGWAAPVAASRRALGNVSAGDSDRVQIDATDAVQLRNSLEGVGSIVNCVAGSAETIIRSASALFSVIAGMAKPPRVVHLSSMAVYGDAEGPVDESHEPTGRLSAYGSAKLESERLAAPEMPVVVLRPGIVYGPGSAQWSERIAKLLHTHRLGDLGKAGDGYCNLVYVDDTVAVILRALREPNIEGKVFNLSLPEPPTWNEYFVRYARSLGAVPVSRITHRKLVIESKILAPPQKIAQVIIGKLAPRLAQRLPPPIPSSLVRLFAQEIKMTVHTIEKSLGLVWTPLETGLKRTAEWYGPPR